MSTASSPQHGLARPDGPQRLATSSHQAAVPAIVCRVEGEADHTTSPLLQDALAKAIADSPAVLVVDLAALTFCDSACLNTLLRAHHDAQAADVWLILSGPGPQLLRLLSITGTDQVLTIQPHVRTTPHPHPAGLPVSDAPRSTAG
ncbi:hypothetical protein CFP65_7163 [Kitasatospora sp. MMS16-BH015]|uniref:STAS domain-containing protein n=1 Tax=Kitasatospora sp. MMS16-BH015 TaxID=2018025 RepID=UPI000CA3B3CD|nr:STAS domain-containing protein [Kitasatospora sp. MMS16-BH015]AUG81759.1 hypothetical protein CFP65_7163 [Kitasatospora sp. MMS16-BH015]